MSHERRFLLFVILMFAWLMGFPYLMRSLGLAPAPPPKKEAPGALEFPEVADQKRGDPSGKGNTPSKPAPDSTIAGPVDRAESGRDGSPKRDQENLQESFVELVPPNELVLGSASDRSPAGYRLEVRLEQKGAGVDSVFSSRFEAEFEGRRNPHRPLQLIRRDPLWPAPLSFTLVSEGRNELPAETGEIEPLPDRIHPGGFDRDREPGLDTVVWQVVRDDQQRIVRPIQRVVPSSGQTLEGQELVFRTQVRGGIVVTKTFRLWQAEDGFSLEIKFESPEREHQIAYEMLGPHGIPIEGEWYTGTFRDVVFGTLDRGSTHVVTWSAYDVAKSGEKAIDSTALPLLFAGVENQYFAVLLQPDPPPSSEADRIERATTAVVIHRNEASLQTSDVGVRLRSRPVRIGPNLAVTHGYRVFAGPKTEEALQPFGAEELAGYRKSWIPGASFIARYFITPTLSFTYRITEVVARLFGGSQGNYGVAIILLTLLVKLVMFPLGRKQALMAQRTQELQPYLKEIQEKYKDDRERLTRETLALYKRHGVNPVSGCLPALIQLPIFVGLWQALNASVALRHSPFLWIHDLSAPDMLFRFPFEIIFLGQWFNLLPIVVVVLMLIQTKLFAPPATTPEAEMQQKMMKYMMIFMAVMFYKVPSGLGIYFITSSLWSIGERLLLPKLSVPTPESLGTSSEPPSDAEKPSPIPATGPATKKPISGLAQFWEKILEDARKDPTYRKMVEGRDASASERKGDSDRRRDRGKPRARPRRK